MAIVLAQRMFFLNESPCRATLPDFAGYFPEDACRPGTATGQRLVSGRLLPSHLARPSIQSRDANAIGNFLRATWRGSSLGARTLGWSSIASSAAEGRADFLSHVGRAIRTEGIFLVSTLGVDWQVGASVWLRGRNSARYRGVGGQVP